MARRHFLATEKEQGNTDLIVLRQQFPLLGAYVAPRSHTEQKLAEIFRMALRMDEVSITDDFEQLGGDSLIAVSIYADIEKAFDIEVAPGSLARLPTIEQLASTIDKLVAKSKA